MFTKIEELIVRKNYRFLNKGTTEIHYTPQKELQLVLGSNGFGKSSLLDIASPLPPNKKSYAKGGYCYVRIRHNNSVYELEADFKTGAKYSFVRDGGENLNSGRTYTIQKKLVEEHFKYTQEVHDLLMGRVNFVGMTVSQRKEWIVKLCPSDTSYAMDILKESLRQQNQLKGTIKKTKEKLFTLQSDLISETELAEIENSIALRLDQIVKLTEHTDNTAKWDMTKDDTLFRLETDITNSVNKIKRFKSSVIDNNIKKLGDVSRDVFPMQVRKTKDDEAERLSALTAKVKSHYEEHQHLQEMIDSIAQDAEITTAEVEARIAQIDSELPTIRPHKEIAGLSELPILMKQSIEVSSSINNLLSRLPENPDRSIYSSEIMNRIEAQLDKQHRTRTIAVNGLDSALRRKRHIEDQHDVNCPECKFTWRPGVGKTELQDLDVAIAKHENDLKVIDEAIEVSVSERSLQDGYRELMVEYKQLTDAYPRLSLLWDRYMQDGGIYNSPKSLMPVVSQFVEALESEISRSELIEERKKMQSVLDVRKLTMTVNADSLNSRLEHLSTEIEELVKQSNQLSSRQETLKYLDVSLTAVQNEMDQLNDNLTKHLRLNMDRFKAEKADKINELMRSAQTSLAMLQERLNSNSNKLEVCKTFEDMISEMSDEMEGLRLVSEVLSPFDGLISEILDEFLKEMTGAMNGIANRIWDHTYYIHTCGAGSDGLDYKFPLTANEAKRAVGDISEGSEGERELANFLFLMVARLYLGLEHYPIYLDEVGKYFTESHRTKLYNYIKILIEGKSVGQVMVVSHFPSTHNSLVNADFNYIDPTGVTVPKNGNVALKIK